MIPLLDGLDRDAAREAARRELSRKPYQDAKPSWTYRLLNWLFEKVDEALSRPVNYGRRRLKPAAAGAADGAGHANLAGPR